MTMSTLTTASTIKVRLQRIQAGSCGIGGFLTADVVLGSFNEASGGTAAAPAFQYVDQHQHGKGNHQQHDRNRRRFPVREFLETGDDQHRGNLCVEGLV